MAAFKPTLTQFETRDVPSVVFDNPQKPIVQSPGELSFWDNEDSSAIVITNTGKNAANNLTITTYHRAAYEAYENGTGPLPPQTSQSNWPNFYQNKNIWKLTINDAGGGDYVKYNVDSHVDNWAYHELHLNMDRGVTDGNDKFQATVNGVGWGGGINFYADGGRGNDTLNVRLNGFVDHYGGLGMGLWGGDGADNVGANVWSSVYVAPNATVWANLYGHGRAGSSSYDGGDTVSLWYLGELDGRLTYNIYGGHGADEIQANVWTNHTSNGYVGTIGSTSGAGLYGGDGNDAMYYLARGTGAQWHGAYVDGGSNHDTLHRSATNESVSFAISLDPDGTRSDNNDNIWRTDSYRWV